MLHKPSAALRIYVFINQTFQKVKEGDLCITTMQHSMQFSSHDGRGFLQLVVPHRNKHSTCGGTLQAPERGAVCRALLCQTFSSSFSSSFSHFE